MFFSQRIAEGRRSAVLPNNCVVNRLACFSVPDQSRFALISNAERSNVAGFQIHLSERVDSCPDLRLPDLQRIMLDPPVVRKDLCILPLAQRDNTAVTIKDNTSAAGCALVKGENECHFGTILRIFHNSDKIVFEKTLGNFQCVS